MKVACLSVDLDSLGHYCRIYGLPENELPAAGLTAAHAIAIPRFLELFDRVHASGTLFAIGEDLDHEPCAKPVADAHRAGHEVGNHTWSHDYALVRRGAQEIASEIANGARAIERVTGAAPTGFRAPGYTLSSGLYAALVEQRYAYDSSAFPAVPYYLAKATILGAMKLVGRTSASILDRPGVLAAPRMPYRPSPEAPYRRGAGAVWELPIATAPFTRVPFYGTSLVALPRAMVAGLYRTLRGSSFLNIEMHSVDVLDASDGAGPRLPKHQRDLRVPAGEKMARLADVFGWIAQDFELVTLRVAAARLTEEAD
jgi:peptidoglycan-N-acetylglucosamine deacetylase